jgi:hypothetical protein
MSDQDRWTSTTIPHKTYQNDYEVSWESYDYYFNLYYDDLKNVSNNAGIRDFNYSNYIATKSAEKYPMK